MTFPRVAVAIVCLLAAVSGAQAQQVCLPHMASGTYLMNLSGWATVATTPIPIFAPVAVQQVVKLDADGNVSGASTAVSVVGGTPSVLTGLKAKMTIAVDCTLTFKASCAEGCQWEGQGYFNKTSKEISIIFTKVVDYPLTVTGTLKQVSN